MIKLITLPLITISVSNTPTKVNATSLRVTSLTLQADKNNSVSVYLGGDDVTAASGLEILPGETAEITADNIRAGSEEFDISEVYLTSGTTGMTIRAAAFTRRI